MIYQLEKILLIYIQNIFLNESIINY